MGRVYLEYDKHRCKWREKDSGDFWIDAIYKQKLDKIKQIIDKGWDAVIIIDGKERSGKSILGMITGWYLSNTKLGLNNFARGLDDVADKIAKLPDKSVLIMDEGSLVFSSKDSTSGYQKKLIKIMDVVGQKNMVFIICLPCFFDLNKTIAVRRSVFMCHVYPDHNYNRGRFAYWGENTKKALYEIGKRKMDSYKEPKAQFVAQYPNFEPPFYTEYKEIVKKESLKEVLREATVDKVDPDKAVRDIRKKVISYLTKKTKITQIHLARAFGVTARTITNDLQEIRADDE